MSDANESGRSDSYTRQTRCVRCGERLSMMRQMLECRLCYDCQQRQDTLDLYVALGVVFGSPVIVGVIVWVSASV